MPAPLQPPSAQTPAKTHHSANRISPNTAAPTPTAAPAVLHDPTNCRPAHNPHSQLGPTCTSDHPLRCPTQSRRCLPSDANLSHRPVGHLPARNRGRPGPRHDLASSMGRPGHVPYGLGLSPRPPPGASNQLPSGDRLPCRALPKNDSDHSRTPNPAPARDANSDPPRAIRRRPSGPQSTRGSTGQLQHHEHANSQTHHRPPRLASSRTSRTLTGTPDPGAPCRASGGSCLLAAISESPARGPRCRRRSSPAHDRSHA